MASSAFSSVVFTTNSFVKPFLEGFFLVAGVLSGFLNIFSVGILLQPIKEKTVKNRIEVMSNLYLYIVKNGGSIW